MGLRKILRQEKPLIISIIFALLFIALVMPYVWKSPYIEHVSFAVLDEDNSALSRKITELVKTNNYVDVNYYPSSEDELEKAIKKGKVYGRSVVFRLQRYRGNYLRRWSNVCTYQQQESRSCKSLLHLRNNIRRSWLYNRLLIHGPARQKGC